jgi:threonine dehydrogenase-like Zn-dependent dehydrogenase
MQALVFHRHLARMAAARLLGTFSSRAYVGGLSPLQLCEVPEPALPGDDWVLLGTRLCGVCGSDSKQVFLEGSWDNPMTALISFPQILGHEVVADVLEAGPAVGTLAPGDRVVLNPWLSCAPRGLPPCEWCERGELAQCRNFTRGRIGPGIHTGNSRDAGGGFAPRLPAHESQCIPIPDTVSDEAAVLADPFSVSLHAVLHEPPPERGVALVYGCGTLGLLSIAILRRLHPHVRVLAVARYPHQQRLAEALGAERALPHRPTASLVEQVATALGVDLQQPERGLPMLNGGVDVVYDSVASAETLEVGVRVVRPRGRIVATGVSTPRRFEWTPLYFKEIKLIGSNAFAIEEYEGRRQHAMAWYLEWAEQKDLDVTSIVTHRYSLADYPEAFLACHDQGHSGAVKVLFRYGDA